MDKDGFPETVDELAEVTLEISQAFDDILEATKQGLPLRIFELKRVLDKIVSRHTILETQLAAKNTEIGQLRKTMTTVELLMKAAESLATMIAYSHSIDIDEKTTARDVLSLCKTLRVALSDKPETKE